MYNGDGDLTALGTAIMNSNPQGISATEWAGVGAVGVGATLLVRNVLPVLAVGTAMYVLGYYVRGMRPEDGWMSGK